MCTDSKRFKVKVPIFFSGTQGFPARREGHYLPQKRELKPDLTYNTCTLQPDSFLALPASAPSSSLNFRILRYLDHTTHRILVLEMASAYLAECGSCGIGAIMKCVGCMDAPEYQPGDSVRSVYCNRDCQKGHWQKHKANCRALGQRKKLLRTANTLKAALLTYREVVYDVDLTKIEFHGGVLCLHQNQRAITAPSKRGLFPDHLTTNIEYKEAALVNNQCTTAMALLGPLTRKLLIGEIPKSIGSKS